MGVGGDELTIALVYLAIVIVIFLIFRELVCWYWKINASLEVLREIRDLLKEQR